MLIATYAVTFRQDAIDGEVGWRLADTVGHFDAFFAACMTQAMKILELSSRQSLLIQQLWEDDETRAHSET